jgi:hypothetical protein
LIFGWESNIGHYAALGEKILKVVEQLRIADSENAPTAQLMNLNVLHDYHGDT